MITKGIVEEIITPYAIKVRKPIFDSASTAANATLTEDLDAAVICSLPNSANQVNVGDIVFVAFEDDDISKPIIIGTLFKDTPALAYPDITARVFKTISVTTLDEQTSIGNIMPDEIKTLSGIQANIQDQLNALSSRISNLESI